MERLFYGRLLLISAVAVGLTLPLWAAGSAAGGGGTSGSAGGTAAGAGVSNTSAGTTGSAGGNVGPINGGLGTSNSGISNINETPTGLPSEGSRNTGMYGTAGSLGGVDSGLSNINTTPAGQPNEGAGEMSGQSGSFGTLSNPSPSAFDQRTNGAFSTHSSAPGGGTGASGGVQNLPTSQSSVPGSQ